MQQLGFAALRKPPAEATQFDAGQRDSLSGPRPASAMSEHAPAAKMQIDDAAAARSGSRGLLLRVVVTELRVEKRHDVEHSGGARISFARQAALPPSARLRCAAPADSHCLLADVLPHLLGGQPRDVSVRRQARNRPKRTGLVGSSARRVGRQPAVVTLQNIEIAFFLCRDHWSPVTEVTSRQAIPTSSAGSAHRAGRSRIMSVTLFVPSL
jgi:hypothetical protein